MATDGETGTAAHTLAARCRGATTTELLATERRIGKALRLLHLRARAVKAELHRRSGRERRSA